MTARIEWRSIAGEGPLGGMRVLDLSQQLPGPYATALLAGLGADVVKVEPPGGDAGRVFDPEMFVRANMWKRGVRLDLKDDADRAELLRLAVDADAFFEGFRPGVVARLGCDYDTIRAINPGIVYCSISGFGQAGPLANHPTHDISLQAMGGVLVDGAVIDRIGVPWVDLATGSAGALLAVSAWQSRRGGYFDVAMLDAAWSWSHFKRDAVTAVEPTYGTVSTSDGLSVVIAILEDPMWERLCIALGWGDWSNAEGYKTYQERRIRAIEIRKRLDVSFGTLTAARIASLASEHDLPIEVVNPADPEVMEQLAVRTGMTGTGGPRLPIPVDWQHPIDPDAKP